MEAIANHRDWVVWQSSIALATALHSSTCPEVSNDSALREQMKKCSIMLATHVAESVSLASRSERVRVLGSARSLLARLEVQLQICERMRLADDLPNVSEQIVLLRRLLDGVIQRLREQPNRDARSTVSMNTRPPSVVSAAGVTTSI
jgi:four helix bundle protein